MSPGYPSGGEGSHLADNDASMSCMTDANTLRAAWYGSREDRRAVIFRNLARILTVVLVGVGALVACSNDRQACAADAGNPRNPPRPGSQRTSSKVQDRPMSTSGWNPGSSKKTMTNPYWRTSSKPTTWGAYDTGGRNWSQSYRKNMTVAPQR